MRTPVIVLILAATAVPIDWQPTGSSHFDYAIDLSSHFWVNVAGYLPLGFVLADIGLLWAVVVGAAMSVLIETAQLPMLYRDPSLSDIIANTLGTLLGAALAIRCGIRTVELPIKRRIGFIAAALACGIVLWMWAESGGPVHQRGWASPGILEASWGAGKGRRSPATDSSAANPNVQLSPVTAEGFVEHRADFDGDHYVELGPASAIRLAGSMTITAWINAASFPRDDAAIVSQLSHSLGYQLDTTVDKGQRTIGFKLTNAHGQWMIRYGRTPLVVNKWYHIAGVYDARVRTLDVYLDGRQDDGQLTGVVTGTQHPSREAAFIGRRADFKGFEFTGLIDDVRIYSLALKESEIKTVMSGGAVERARGASSRRSFLPSRPALLAESYDIEIPLAAAATGMFAAVACIALWPTNPSWVAVGVSALVGLLLLAGTGSDLPLLDWISLPLTSIIAGTSVIISRRYRQS